ncbi:MAG: hypothetical protein AB7P04_14670 [Bacteriovoracia bacterium]
MSAIQFGLVLLLVATWADSVSIASPGCRGQLLKGYFRCCVDTGGDWTSDPDDPDEGGHCFWPGLSDRAIQNHSACAHAVVVDYHRCEGEYEPDEADERRSPSSEERKVPLERKPHPRKRAAIGRE